MELETHDEEEAIDDLKRQCLNGKTQEVFLFEVNTDGETHVTSGHEIFTRDFKPRTEGSRDIWCLSCGYIWEAVTDEELAERHTRSFQVEKTHGIETHHYIQCINKCIGRMEYLVEISPK